MVSGQKLHTDIEEPASGMGRRGVAATPFTL